MTHLNIREYNIKELILDGKLFTDQERQLFSNETNLFYGIPKDRINGKLGYTSFSGETIPGFTITEWEIMFYEDVRVSEYSNEPVLSFHFMSEGETLYELKNNNVAFATTGTNNLWSLSGGYFGYAVYKKNTYCSSFIIFIHNEFLEELVGRYPELYSDTYKRCKNGESFFLYPYYKNTSLEMKYIVSQIRNANLMGAANQIYKEAKILELLALQLQQHNSEKTNIYLKYCKTKSDIDKIHEAKDMLLMNLNNPPTIRELSRHVGIDEKKLKYGFKEVYNQTVYGCLFDHKMDLARQLLLDTDDSILDVALKCGYDYASHFTTAFKRKFGIAPKAFKKKG